MLVTREICRRGTNLGRGLVNQVLDMQILCCWQVPSQKWCWIICQGRESRTTIDPERGVVVVAGGGVTRHGGSRVRERNRKRKEREESLLTTYETKTIK